MGSEVAIGFNQSIHKILLRVVVLSRLSLAIGLGGSGPAGDVAGKL